MKKLGLKCLQDDYNYNGEVLGSVDFSDGKESTRQAMRMVFFSNHQISPFGQAGGTESASFPEACSGYHSYTPDASHLRHPRLVQQAPPRWRNGTVYRQFGASP